MLTANSMYGKIFKRVLEHRLTSSLSPVRPHVQYTLYTVSSLQSPPLGDQCMNLLPQVGTYTRFRFLKIKYPETSAHAQENIAIIINVVKSVNLSLDLFYAGPLARA